MRSYRAYLFDLDGTIVHTAPDIESALNHSLSVYNLATVDETVTRDWVGQGAKILIERALDHQELPDMDSSPLLEVFLNYYEQHIADKSTPYPGVIETLIELKTRGAKLAVITNKMARFAHPLLEKLDLKQYFSEIVSGDTLSTAKPDPGPALYTCDKLQVETKEALFVGDSITDVKCARAACCPIVCVNYGYNQGIKPSKLGADQVIRSIRELIME
ncbi:MAG: phosphoglycolate phosphatase [Gammaproteobacteria bacterium]|nr:phosphoglycolate phosphatase [Gammaproteobacteria bacterium]